MRFNWFGPSILAPLFFVVAAIPAFAQVRPAATNGGMPLVVGAGFSSYNVDFGSGYRKDGGTLWADWTIRQMPRILQGLGVEMVARDISFGGPAGLSTLRYDTAGGGAIYHYLRPRNVRPYAKVLEAFGSIDFPPAPGSTYAHDTRNFLAIGGGADFHAWRQVWVRADYEYQMWRQLFGSPHALTPNGFTFGPEFDFGGRGRR